MQSVLMAIVVAMILLKHIAMTDIIEHIELIMTKGFSITLQIFLHMVLLVV